MAALPGAPRAATRQQYTWAVGDLVSRLGKAKLSRLTPKMIQQVYVDLATEGLSNTSVQLVGKVLRMALGDAVNRGLITRSPAAVVALPSIRRSGIDCWSREQMLAFLDADAVTSDRLAVLWRVALATGLRRGELVALRWRDVDLQAQRLFVRQAAALDGYAISFGPPKTRASIRTVALDDDTTAALTAWRDDQAAEHEMLGTVRMLVTGTAPIWKDLVRCWLGWPDPCYDRPWCPCVDLSVT